MRKFYLLLAAFAISVAANAGVRNLYKQDFEAVKKQIVFMKKYRGLFQYGTLYRLQSPFEKNIASWMVVSEDKKQAIVVMYKTHKTPNVGMECIKLQGLDADSVYTINGDEKMYGDLLMERGLGTMGNDEPWYKSDKDFTSRMFILEA